MNHPKIHTIDADLWGRSLAKRLDIAALDIGHDISERLRVARQHALASRTDTVMMVKFRTAALSTASGQGTPDEGLNLWRILASALPLIGLVLGLILVQVVQQELIEADMVSIDSALLLDDLPPDAYTDPGFLQFLKVQLVQPSRND